MERVGAGGDLELYVEHARQVGVVERHEPGDADKEHDAEAPRVRQHRVVRRAAQHLGRHVRRAAAVRRAQHPPMRRLNHRHHTVTNKNKRTTFIISGSQKAGLSPHAHASR